MLAKAIATGFNSPFISIPGSGFAATFIGIDAIIVRILARRAKKLARKWGGQCIVFIDEIDAVGMRRQALGQGGRRRAALPPAVHARRPVRGPPVLRPEGLAGPLRRPRPRDARLARAAVRASARPSTYGMRAACRRGSRASTTSCSRAAWADGRRARAEPAARRDGRHRQPAVLQAVLHEQARTRCSTPATSSRGASAASSCGSRRRGRGSEQIYFIGATNVPIDRLDPALIRPGRMGRHVWFRTPTKHDRLDILDLYIGKVVARRRSSTCRPAPRRDRADHERVLAGDDRAGHVDGARRSRTTPAATAFVWDDLVEAMTTLEPGTAVGVEYVPKETRAVAIHEAGHAIAGHAYMTGTRVDAPLDQDARRLGSGTTRRSRRRSASAVPDEMFARLVWGLGAMAAERVFYGENSNGVGGDVAVRDGAGGRHGRTQRRWARSPSHVKPEGRRDGGGGAQARARPLRGHRPPDHEPHGRRRAFDARPDRRRPRGPVEARARRADPRPGLRRRAQPRRAQPRGGREDRRRAGRAHARSSATSSSTCSTPAASGSRRSTTATRPCGLRSFFAAVGGRPDDRSIARARARRLEATEPRERRAAEDTPVVEAEMARAPRRAQADRRRARRRTGDASR